MAEKGSILKNKHSSRVLMVIPRFSYTNKRDYNYLVPLGLGYIISALKSAGIETDCINLNHCDGTTEELMKRKLDEKRYDFVCTGYTAIGYRVIKKIIDSTRDHKTKPRFILGGALITSEPEFMFHELEPDFAVIGEGEVTIVDLITCIEKKKNLEGVDGITFKKEGKLVFTKQRELIDNINKIPIPDFDAMELEEQMNNMHTNDDHHHNPFDYPRAYPVMCSRSCPFQCTFCCHTLGRKYRERTIENVMRELKDAVRKYRVNMIVIYDDLFASNRTRLREFCREFKKLIGSLEWECKWTCQLWVSSVDRETLEMMKDSGCELIGFGYESFNRNVLKSMKKNITPEQIALTTKLCREMKIGLQANFLFGDVAETKESARETLDYWKKNCEGQVWLTFIQPYPGTEIYNHCLRRGIIRDKRNFFENMKSEFWFNMTEKMSDSEISDLKREIIRARVKYRRFVVPSSVKKTGEKVYTVKVGCPFCGKAQEYRNFMIENRKYYHSFMMCRDCRMRFNVGSSLKKLVHRYYASFEPLMNAYVKTRNSIRKGKI